MERQTRKVKVLRVVLLQHPCSQVRQIHPSITLSCQVNLIVLDSEEVLEVLKEAKELLCHLLFVGSSGGSDGKASADRLIDPAQQSLCCLRKTCITHQIMLVRFDQA